MVLLALWNGCYDLLWCRDYVNPTVSFFAPLLVVFPFSLITYKMREEVFEAWRDFSYWWIPLSIFLVLITPEGNSVIMSWGKEIPAIGMSALYVLISVIIIMYKYRSLK